VELSLNRRQRICDQIRLGDLAETHSVEELRDPGNPAHNASIDVVRRLAGETPACNR
jgi:hypothetical protein